MLFIDHRFQGCAQLESEGISHEQEWPARTVPPLNLPEQIDRHSPVSDGTMHLILFIVFAALCLTGAVNLLLQKHPINSALSLIVVMTSLAVLYLLLGAEFLAAAQVIVYAGAIMVLFTFVVMLLNAGREERTLGSRAARTVGFPAVVAILARDCDHDSEASRASAMQRLKTTSPAPLI